MNSIIRNNSSNKIYYSTKESVGFDIPSNEEVWLLPFQIKSIKTGLFFDIEEAFTKLTPQELADILSCDESTVRRRCKKGLIKHKVENGKYLIYSSELTPEDTDFDINIYSSYELQIRPRSSSLLKEKIHVQLGTIDPDYKGEIHVIVQNVSLLPKKIFKGQRIAQGVISKVLKDSNIKYTSFIRNKNGLGSTGKWLIIIK